MLENRTTGEINMGRYPFMEGVHEYLPSEEGHLEVETMKSLDRRLRQIAGIFHKLKEEGKISTDNPKKVTPDDIDVFVGFRRKSGVKASTVNKDLGNLEKMLTYFDNDAVKKFKIKYPSHYPKRYKKRGASLEEEKVQMILEKAMKINIANWELMEAYGLVSLAITTGFRPKELRMLSISNVTVTETYVEIYAEHVKGEGLYGNSRYVTMHPDGVPVFKRYLEARTLRLEKSGKKEDALFPPLKHNGGYISYGRIRVLKSMVEDDLDIKFDLRKCRRTFGQRAINEGQSIHNVSLVMGHSTMATTQKDYCDKDEHDAARDMQKYWDAQEASE
jgi:integrase/recombinase XerD